MGWRNKFRGLLILGSGLCVGWSAVFWKPKLPAGFPTPTTRYSTDMLKPGLVELGRTLFFDPILSADSTISCASCHSPFNAFAHSDHRLSHGIGDSVLERNAPALFNLAWQNNFMWDGAIPRLYSQPLAPIENKKEMGSSIPAVLNRLNRSPLYRKVLSTTLKKQSWDTDALLTALEAFQLTLISANSKFDKITRRERGVSFTSQEKNGYLIFKQKCNSCHTEPLFTHYGLATNKLMPSNLADLGRFRVTQNPKDSYLFKVPSLRNLSYTMPYMHDGRFNTLSQVVSHYQSQEQMAGVSMRMTDNEKRDLIAFLLTLNDEDFIRNVNHHFPLNRLRD